MELLSANLLLLVPVLSCAKLELRWELCSSGAHSKRISDLRHRERKAVQITKGKQAKRSEQQYALKTEFFLCSAVALVDLDDVDVDPVLKPALVLGDGHVIGRAVALVH